TVLNGVYRIKWSRDELVAAGANPHYAKANFGFLDGREDVLTLTMQDGDFRVRAPGASWSPCPGTYGLTRTVITIRFRPPQCEGRITAQWSLQRGQLLLRVRRASDPGDAVAFGARPWPRIGGTPLCEPLLTAAWSDGPTNHRSVRRGLDRRQT